jgi:hypothetical protein
MPTLAVDVAPAIFEAMVKLESWITDKDAWKPIAAAFPTQHSAYAQQLREARQDALAIDMLASHKVINVRENSMLVLRTWEDISTT